MALTSNSSAAKERTQSQKGGLHPSAKDHDPGIAFVAGILDTIRGQAPGRHHDAAGLFTLVPTEGVPQSRSTGSWDPFTLVEGAGCPSTDPIGNDWFYGVVDAVTE